MLTMRDYQQTGWGMRAVLSKVELVVARIPLTLQSARVGAARVRLVPVVQAVRVSEAVIRLKGTLEPVMLNSQRGNEGHTR